MRVGQLGFWRIIVQQFFEDVIFWDFEGTNKRSFGDFLKMKSDRHKVCKCFDAFQRRSFECSQYLDGGSSLHFVEDFHMI